MDIKLAIELIKEVRSWMAEGVNPDMFTNEIEAIDTVVSYYEKSEKVDFLKSAKQPSEITHPYDLSKNRRKRND